MATIADLLADPELVETEWDLDPLVDRRGPAGVERQLEQATARASAFSERYANAAVTILGRGRTPPEPPGLVP